MDGHLIARLVVDALDDIDLAILGPLRAREPIGRPGTAGRVRDVAEVGDEEAVVVGGVALQLDAVAARTGGTQDAGVVDADVDLVVDDLVEARGLGLRGGDVGHEAFGGIGFLGRR